MAKATMIEAINRAHAWEMASDPTVVVLGEDIGVNGGVFRATAGLQEKFGKDRVQDTPLAEGMIAGMSLGMASQGLKPHRGNPVHGIHLSRRWTRSPITWPACVIARVAASRCPLVMRMPHGGGIHAPEHHSESLEAMLAHHPEHSGGVPPRRRRGPTACCWPPHTRSGSGDVLEPVRLYRQKR